LLLTVTLFVMLLDLHFLLGMVLQWFAIDNRHSSANHTVWTTQRRSQKSRGKLHAIDLKKKICNAASTKYLKFTKSLKRKRYTMFLVVNL
jgi:hypothetical protein